MSRIVVCMDCPNYQKGGYCYHEKKDVGALSPACGHAKNLNQKFNPEDNDQPMKTPLAPQAHTKTCTKCGRELPGSEFYAKAGSKDGLQTQCKDCHNAVSRSSKDKTKAQEQPKQVVVRETLTDKQMVELLREHGWTVTCYRTITEEL